MLILILIQSKEILNYINMKGFKNNPHLKLLIHFKISICILII